VQVTPGATYDREGPALMGATSVENQYIIEGLNTTGVELGQPIKQLNFEFIEEIQVLSGGLPAEYGRLTGGLVNAITKSGGNEFHGDLFGYFRDEDLQTDNTTQDQLRLDAFQVVETAEEQDYGADLGGYMVRDRLWFFAAYNQVDETELKSIVRDIPSPGAPLAGDAIPTDFNRDLWAGKLTWSVNPRHTLTASAFGDPSDEEGDVGNERYQQITGPATTFFGTREFGGTDYIARWDGVFSQNWAAEAIYGHHEEENLIAGPGKSIPHFIDQSVEGNPTFGGFPFHQDQEFERDIGKLDATWFAGAHEIKFGGDQEELSAVNANWNGGAGQRIYIRPLRAGFPQYFRHRFFIDPNVPGFDRDDPSTWVPAVPLTTTPETTNTAGFVQDSFRITPNFTVNYGVRWESQEIADTRGTDQATIDDSWAPRLGAIWDPTGTGRGRLYGNFGRYYHSIPMDINIRAFGGEITCFCYNFSDDPANFLPDPSAPEQSSLLGGTTEPVDPDLKGQSVDEFLLGYEHEVAPNFALGVQGTYRDLNRVVEDFLVVGEGTYFIANPGEGVFGREVTFYDYFFDEFPNGDPVLDATAPVDVPTREYRAVQFTARKRYSDNWQLLASYVWSELEGNYDGAFQVSTGQLDPNINSAFDYADFLVNAEGPLSLDQEHQARIDASYVIPEGPLRNLVLGGTAYYKSGFPLNAYGYSSAYNNNEFYLVPRGSLGHGPDQYEVHLHLGYPIRLGGDREINLDLTVLNLLDRQEPTRLDERYNRPEDGFCDEAGIPIALCNNQGGIRNVPDTVEPIGALDNPQATSPNPNFLTRGFRSTDFTGQRTFRVGARFRF